MANDDHWLVRKQMDILFLNHDGSVVPGTARLIECPKGHSVILRTNFEPVEGVGEVDAPCPKCEREWPLRLEDSTNDPAA